MDRTGAASLWVRIEPPEDWVVARDATRRSARPRDGGLVLEWFPLGALPRRQMDWVRRVMASGLEPGRTVGALDLARTETAKGWPLLLVETEIAGGAAWARRLAAFYAFFEHGGHALVHATDPAAWAEKCEALRGMLALGEPDFGELVVSLDRLYDGA